MFEPKATASHLDSTLLRHTDCIGRRHLLRLSSSEFDPLQTFYRLVDAASLRSEPIDEKASVAGSCEDAMMRPTGYPMKAAFFTCLTTLMLWTPAQAGKFDSIHSDMADAAKYSESKEAQACSELPVQVSLDRHENEAALITLCNSDPSPSKFYCKIAQDLIADLAVHPNPYYPHPKLPTGLTCK